MGILPNVTLGMEWVLDGEGIATEKIDGSCCAIINGVFYKRYDAKKGKVPPAGTIPCCEPDEVTGHWPHWVKVVPDDRSDVWHMVAYENSKGPELADGTYEVKSIWIVECKVIDYLQENAGQVIQQQKMHPYLSNH